VDVNDNRLAFGVNSFFFPFADAGGDKIVLIAKIFDEHHSADSILFESSFEDCLCSVAKRVTGAIYSRSESEFKKATAECAHSYIGW